MIRGFHPRGAATASCSFLVLGLLLFSSPLLADETPKASDPATEQRLKELEQKLDVLTREIESLRVGETPSATPVPAAPAPGSAPPPADQASASRFGLGPAAARVYARKGVSIGGYGEVLYQGFASAAQDGSPSGLTNTIDLSRAVLYFGYKFDDHFVFNSEVEFAHAVAASDKEGEVEVEFAYVDWLSHSSAFRARAGLLLIPMGFINELHEPPTFLGARRPDVERLILPTTWRELGLGAYGEAGPLAYRLYFVNGLNSEGFTADEGIREGRQEGSLAKAQDFALTGRLDFVGVNGLVAGASFFTGCSGQGRTTAAGETVCGRTTVWDVHADFRWRGLSLRALFAGSTIGDAADLNALNGLSGDECVGSRQRGWYAEAGFDVLTLVPRTKLSLTPFVRYEEWDTQASVPDGFSRNPENDASQWTAGVVFKPIPQVVVKVDGQWRKNAASTGVNQFNVALGYEF